MGKILTNTMMTKNTFVREPSCDARRERRITFWAVVVYICISIIWGINFPLMKIAFSQISPMAFNIIRFGVASISLIIIMLIWEGWQRIPLKHWILLAIQGFFHVFLYQLLFINNLSFTSSGIAAVLTSTTPLWTAFLVWSFKVEKINGWIVSGAIVGFLGVVMVIGGGMRSLVLSTASKSELVMLLSAVVWSLGTIITKKLLVHYSPLRIIALMMPIGYLGTIIAGLPSTLHQDWYAISGKIWAIIIFSTFFAVTAGYSCWSWAVQRIGATRTSVVGNLAPVVAFIAAFIISGEQVSIIQIIGSAVILAGIWFCKRG
ncbi:MAG: hypothetical protein A2Y62_07165 [Candidatus Fischerbacteria bacterium RBG_13_37_8]|uniref:EamA domain-containing protein n=1 Tax=Candidatus Fischerbacteria bacterium RBG_13_37_8 TaxID=1817863 RepID=A0A1F5VUT5_9BACT|nr:MAG: hypothetical protein A2Y62_07165 [Candidatus Fischerbacteria bacterium RBG_13_37_8]